MEWGERGEEQILRYASIEGKELDNSRRVGGYTSRRGGDTSHTSVIRLVTNRTKHDEAADMVSINFVMVILVWKLDMKIPRSTDAGIIQRVLRRIPA